MATHVQNYCVAVVFSMGITFAPFLSLFSPFLAYPLRVKRRESVKSIKEILCNHLLVLERESATVERWTNRAGRKVGMP
jgi:hypothetical protein